MGESLAPLQQANIQLDGSLTVDKTGASTLRRHPQRGAGNYSLRIGGFVTKDFTVGRTVRYFGTPDLNADLDIEASMW
jgi:hypothetical protein